MSKVRTQRAVLFAASFLAAGFVARPVQAQAGLQFFAVTPCRLADTRAGFGGAITQGVFRSFAVNGLCNVDVAAKAVSLNVTIVSPQADGFFALWPYSGAYPSVSTINFAAGEPAIANGAIVPVTAGAPNLSTGYGTCCGGTFTTHVILDVTGYFK